LRLRDAEFICEVDGGLNFKRLKFLQLIEGVAKQQIRLLIIAHKDRLVHFGFKWFEHFIKDHFCELKEVPDARIKGVLYFCARLQIEA
jgi:predicted site-specific integrase-resolvase